MFSKQNLYYTPLHRHEIWRYLTCMFVHEDVFHILSNVFVQLLVGIPLELVHSSWRVVIVYTAGVIGGTLGASVCNPTRSLIGASGGDFALVAAFIPTLILNWREIKDRLLYCALFTILFIFLMLPQLLFKNENVSQKAHMFGAIAGTLVGTLVLKNLKVEDFERKLANFALLVLCTLLITGISIHIFLPTHFYR